MKHSESSAKLPYNYSLAESLAMLPVTPKFRPHTPPLQPVYLPLKVFEALNLFVYNNEFIAAYVRLSLRLEIETLAATQFQREAFTKEEHERAKSIVARLSDIQQSLDELWKSTGWIVNNVQLMRKENVEYVTVEQVTV